MKTTKVVFKLLICSTLICLVMADFKYLSKAYLPPYSQKVVVQSDASSGSTEYVEDLPKTQTVEKELNLNTLEPLTKEAYNDPAYGNIPFGYNGYPGGYPGAVPNQGFPDQVYPHPVFPPQQGLPPYGFPRPGYPSTPNFVNPGYPQQGFPVQGFPGQFYPGQGFPVQGFPGQGFFNPNYPVYFSNYEQSNAEQKENIEDGELGTRVINSKTQYDSTNGGYLYKKPSAIL